MKAIVCELCGSNNLVKEEGLFICQHCRTKYTPEEAKKLMVEGVVEVTGSVRIDNSDNLDKALKNARRAKDDNNSELAEKYYGEVIDLDPDNWEGVFFNTYFKAMQCKIADISVAATSMDNCIETVLNLIKNHVNGVENQEKCVTEMATLTMQMCATFKSAAVSHFTNIAIEIQSKFARDYVISVSACYNTLYCLGDQIEKLFSNEEYARNLAIAAWNDGIIMQGNIGLRFTAAGHTAPHIDSSKDKNTIDHYANKIRKYNPSYELPELKGGKCYVATAVYGSYDCPQVRMLRNYRDNTLSVTWYGRAFIYVYYATSPTLVKLFGKTIWFNRLFRKRLDNIVDRLN